MAYPNSIDTFRTLKDFAITTLTSDITDTDTSIPVEDTSNFPDSGYAVINYTEIIYYTSKTSTSLEGVSRGQLGTTAQSHTSNSVIYHTALSKDFEDIHTSIQNTQRKAGIVTDTPPDNSTVGDKYITTSGIPYIYDGSNWNILIRNKDIYYCNIYYGSVITISSGTDYYFDKNDSSNPTYTETTVPEGTYIVLSNGSVHTRSAGSSTSIISMYVGYYDGSYHNLTPTGRVVYPTTSEYSSVYNGFISTVTFDSQKTISPYIRINVTGDYDVYVGGFSASILLIRVGD